VLSSVQVKATAAFDIRANTFAVLWPREAWPVANWGLNLEETSFRWIRKIPVFNARHFVSDINHYLKLKLLSGFHGGAAGAELPYINPGQRLLFSTTSSTNLQKKLGVANQGRAFSRRNRLRSRFSSFAVGATEKFPEGVAAFVNGGDGQSHGNTRFNQQGFTELQA
jgi:hypothetical protein